MKSITYLGFFTFWHREQSKRGESPGGRGDDYHNVCPNICSCQSVFFFFKGREGGREGGFNATRLEWWKIRSHRSKKKKPPRGLRRSEFGF